MDSQTIDIAAIKQKSAKGILYLSLRNLGIQSVSFVGFFLLTIFLGTAEVGIFAIVAETISVLAYFSDVGLASALIQQKDEVTTTELRTTFTVQQLLVTAALLIFSAFYPAISSSRHFGSPETWIVIALCFDFFVSSLKTIPSVLLERKLNFMSLSTVDIAENITFYLIAVTLAFMGLGIYSYAIAIFFRSLVGVLLMYYISPWSIGYSFSFSSIQRLFKYGIPFQLNSFIALAKDRLSSLLVATIIGPTGFGILAWAQKWPRLSLSLMDSVMRVTFPAFARLQDHPEHLQKSIQKSLFFIALFVFPTLMGASFIAHDFILIFPKYIKWLPAIIPLYFYCLNAAIAAITTPLTNAFNAVGKITVTTKLMIMWTVLTWVFYPMLSYRYGYLGTAIATLVVGASSFIVWWLAKRHFNINVIAIIYRPFLGTIIMGIILLAINQLPLPLIAQIPIKILMGMATYLTSQYIFSKDELLWFLKQLQFLRQSN